MVNVEEDRGFMPILYSIIGATILFVAIIQKTSLSKINKYVIFISLFIVAWFQYTNMTIGVPRVPFQFLCVFTLLAFVAPSIVQINPKTFIKSVMLLPSIGIVYSSSIFSTQDSANDTISMQISYAFLVPVIASIIYLKLYYKHENRNWKIIGALAVLINSLYCYQMLSFGSRGPFLCIISLLLYFVLVKKRNGSGVRLQKSKSLFILILFFFISIFILETLTLISSALHAVGLNLNVIDKNIVKIHETGDISNGRDYIAGLAVQEIYKNPILGYGLDQFENNTGIVYPHNFILQILYDGGLVFFSLLLVPVIYKLYKRIKTCDENEYSLIPFFFFISVPGALLSSDLWYNERLWIFFGVIFAPYFFYRKLKKSVLF